MLRNYLPKFILKYLFGDRDKYGNDIIEKDIEWFKDKQPSSEVLVVWIWDQIVKDFKEVKLHRIRLVETFTIHTDYYGPNP